MSSTTVSVSEDTLQLLSGYLQHTLQPDVNLRKPAEKLLQSLEVNKNYPVLLLSLVDMNSVDASIRVAGAIAFKNYIKRNWKINEDGVDRIHEEDRAAVKQMIVNIMLSSPEIIQKQLSDAISIIGKEDFPLKWPDLLKEMVGKFASGDFRVINGVLHTAHSLFKRYRHEFKSNELWSEIKFVLDEFAQPLTELFVGLMGLAKQHEANQEALKVIFSSLVIVAKIFNSLTFQDLPEFFEDNMQTWMEHFHTLLTVDNPLLKTGDDEEAGLLEQLKSQICENVGMFAQKYDEEFTPFLPNFVTDVWNLLVTTGNQPKYDMLVSNAIQFLAMVADRDKYKSLFEDPNTMSSICEKVIIPNMEFRSTDEELFEDNSEEYIRRDIEGSDVDTRRRSACELVRALSRHFEQQMTTIFGQYVQNMLAMYASNPTANWRNKDAAIYLATSLSAKGQTQKHGITQTNQLINITEFYQTHILPDLSNPNVNQLPVLKADAIKYVMIFRNQLPPEVMKQSIPPLARLLQSEVTVVHTYAAAALDKILLLRLADGTAMIKQADLSQISTQLLSNLFAVLEKPGSKENEYVMKAIMRSFSALQEGIIPFMNVLLPKLTHILMEVSKNPTKPHFNHYMFESLSLCIKIMCRNNPQFVSEFEKILFPIIQNILQQDVTEFIPYIFQMLSLLLEIHTDTIPAPYMILFPCLLAPVLWDRTANIHPLVQLLRSFIAKGPLQICRTDKLGAIFGVFQKLIASKINDHEGFSLMQSLVQHLPEQEMVVYTKQVFILLFHRLTSSKTVKYVKCLLVFFGSYIFKYGATNFIQIIDEIQAKMFAMVLDRIFISETQKVSETADKRILAVGITKLLCESPAMINGDYSNYWAPLLQSLIGLFELPEETVAAADEHFVELEETPGYETTYSRLVFAGKTEADPLQGLGDPKLYLAQSLGKLSAAHPGQLTPLITTGVNPQAQAFLFNYLQLANVSIN